MIVYADIEHSQEPVLDAPASNNRDNTVLYTELQSKNNTAQTAAPTTSDYIQPSQPNVIHGDSVQSQEPVPGNANAPSNNNLEANDAVLCSELLSKDNNADVVRASTEA